MDKRLVVGELSERTGAVTTADLSLIAPFLREPVDADRLMVLPFALANDAVDRGDLRIPQPILSKLAASIIGKPLLLHHDKSSIGEGLWFDASVRAARPGEAGQWTLEARAYLLKTADNAVLREKVAAGIARYCSISFRFDQQLCSACGLDYFGGGCTHVRGEKLPDGSRVYLTFGGDLARYEALEGSLVYLGQQRLAQVLNASEGDYREMDFEKVAQSMGARLEALEQKLAEKPAPVPDSDGAAYRAELVAEVEKCASLLGTQGTAGLALSNAAAQPIASLVALRDDYRKQVAEKFPAAPTANLHNPAVSQEQTPVSPRGPAYQF